jgi:hypothetical protein
LKFEIKNFPTPMPYLKLLLILTLASAGFFALAGRADAATAVYFSVGQTTDDLQTGTSTVTIASGTATFSLAQIGNIGVGDVLTYDTNKVCYISGKTSTTVWDCATATGTAPADISTSTVVSIKRAFSTLSGAESGAATLMGTSSLVSANLQLNFPCYYDSGADTTAVTIEGWTTGADNFIKVYTPNDTATEANFSQRHEGVWDEGKYRIELAHSGNGGIIDIQEPYFYIDGLQIYTLSDNNPRGIGVNDQSAYISNNIIKNYQPDLYNYGTGIWVFDGNSAYIWNNIIYGFKFGEENPNFGGGIVFAFDNNGYAYNNTIYDCHMGFYIYGEENIIKNNIVMNSSNADYHGNPSVLSTHNLSSDATAPAYGTYYRNATVEFVDETNDDYRLAPTDTSAKDAGADLSADSNLAFSTDILGNTRPAGGAWDIGAHEAPARIFRSVGPGATGALATDNSGARTITISTTTSTAVFSAAVADNVGVGDVILYDSNGDNALTSADTIFFIHARVSSTQYSIRDQYGLLAATSTTANPKWAIYRAYTSLALAEAGTKNTSIPISFTGGDRDLVSNNEQWNIACYANGTTADTTAVTIDGWTTGDVNYLKIYTPVGVDEVGVSQRHGGKWDEGKYKITGVSAALVGLYQGGLKIDGLQLAVYGLSDNWGMGFFLSYYANIEDVNISNNIIRYTGEQLSQIRAGIYLQGQDTDLRHDKIKIWNNLIYGFRAGDSDGVGILMGSSYLDVDISFYNNTLVDNRQGFEIWPTNVALLKNNLANNNDTDYYIGGGRNHHASSTYNLSSDNTAPALGTYYRNATVEFMDSANDDYRLSPTDTSAKDAGVDLSADANLAFSTDILGNTRPAGVAWDIGAHEAPVQIFRSVGPGATGALDSDNSGADTLTITSGTSTAVFSAAVPTNVGVGDVILYDSNGDNALTAADTIFFIHSRASSTEYAVRDQYGALSATSTTANPKWAIYRAYTSLALAEAGTKNTSIPISFTGGNRDLVSNNEQWNISCYANGTTADSTAVTVSGWTTDAPNYLKIYTPVGADEVGVSQRHGGKWDETSVYFLNVSTNNNALIVNSSYVVVDGLKIYGTQRGPVIVNGSYGERILKNNIIKGYDSFYLGEGGVTVQGNSFIFKMYNNIIFNQSAYGGFYSGYSCTDLVFYVYSNTFLNNVLIRTAGKQAIFKNNIAASFNTSEGGTFDNLSDYNLSFNETAPGTNSITNATVQFADADNDDFHLSSADTAARNMGADLSADPYLSFSTDIDGHTRSTTTHSGAWDIGADEAATAVYYSTGQSADDLATSSPTVSISAGTAVFSAAQTGNIGVGDVITYNTDQACYISGKVSSTTWTCLTATGTVPADITDSSVEHIKRAFSSLSGAESGSETLLGTSDLASNNFQLNLPCYYDTGADTTAVTIEGWTTASPNYIKVYTPNDTDSEANFSQRHEGVWDEEKWSIQTNVSSVLAQENSYTKLEGLQIQRTDIAGYGINANHTTYVDSSIFWQSAGEVGGIAVYANTGGLERFYLSNSVFFGSWGIGINNNFTAPHYYHNLTFIDCSIGIKFEGSAGIMNLKNSIFYNVGTDLESTSGTNKSSRNNLTTLDSSVSGLNIGDYADNLFSKSPVLVDEANNDFRLSGEDSSGAIDGGADLSADANFAFSTDIIANPRPAGAGWDIGAFEAPGRIYRSVGPGATGALDDDDSGSDTITIATTTSTAVFSAAVADNVGVGDVILYDSNGDNALTAADTIFFIHARASSTQYSIRDQYGLLAATSTTANPKWAIYRAHTSLALAEAGTKNASIPITFSGGDRDLVSNNEQWNIACYANGTTADGTAVTVEDWTTADVNYLKIFTPVGTDEVGVSQRHEGVWDEEKYQLINNDWGNAITAWSAGYTEIDGLQILNQPTSGYDQHGIAMSSGKALNNLVYYNGINGTAVSGIDLQSHSIAYNNIVYNFSTGISSHCGGDVLRCYVYNNTIYNSIIRGIRCNSWRDTLLVNNIVQDSDTDDYSGSCHLDSNYNLSSDGTAPGSNSMTSTTVQFMDADNDDFRLAPTDTSAKDAGTDLSADANLAFSDDIAGNIRPAGSAWDIGAHEAPVQIFRSVGPGATSALDDDDSGADTLTIATSTSDSTAVFSAAVADNVGVGDVILYDSNGDNALTAADTIFFIHSRASSTEYSIRDQYGALAATSTTANPKWAIYRAYTSLAMAEAGTKNTSIPISFTGGDRDLVANNEQWNIACYANGTTADTTAVDIEDWTTDAPNYLKIYTPVGADEVGVSQRHGGKWDEGRYYLSEWNPGPGGVINILINDVVLDGLQIRFAAGGSLQSGVGVNIGKGIDESISAHIEIMNNIIYDYAHNYEQLVVAMPGYGYSTVSLDDLSYIKIYNNIIFNFKGSGMSFRGGSGRTYVYNNTITNGSVGFRQGSVTPGEIVLKNNIAFNNSTNDYSGTFHASSTHNLSSDATAPAYGTYYRNATVQFADADNDDFHLSPQDTSARNMGTDLSADPYLSFSTDIDGHTRSTTTHSGAWDIGADEAATAVYYSTGQNADDLATSSPTVSISAGTAVFSAAQTGNIGVGDVITYDTDQACYISGKVSSTTWTCLTATGTLPADITDSSVEHIKRAFSSLSSAESGSETLLGTSDLADNNFQLNLPCYYDSGADTTAVTISGWTTASPNYIKVYTPNNTATEANFSQRHEGVWDEGKYRLELLTTGAYQPIINNLEEYTEIKGLQFLIDNSYYMGLIIWNQAGNVEISFNLMEAEDDSFTVGIYGNPASPAKIYNNIIHSFNFPSSVAILGGTDLIYNNILIDNYYGVYYNEGNAYTVINNITQDCAIGFYNPYAPFNPASSNNLSSDSTAPGSNSITEATVQFVDEDNDDFRLSLDDTSGAIDGGTDLSAEMDAVDIMGNSRPAGLAWDIGAHEALVKIFRSVGPGATANLNTGSRTVTISGSTATFSDAMPNNVGVGDVLQYQVDSTYHLAFIQSRTSDTVYSVRKADGTAPTATPAGTAVSVFRAYTSLSNAEAGTENTGIESTVRDFDTWTGERDLVANNEQWNIALYANGTTADTSAVSINWTTGEMNYLKIFTPVLAGEAGVSQRHGGIWTNTAYRLSHGTAASSTLDVNTGSIRLEGLQIEADGTGAENSAIILNSGQGQRYLSHSIIKASGNTAAETGVYMGDFTGSTYVYNNIIYGFKGDASSTAIYQDNIAGGHGYFYHNTIADSGQGIAIAAGAATAQNNAVFNTVDDFSGSFTLISYNASDDGDGANALVLGNSKAWRAALPGYADNDFRIRHNISRLYNAGTAISFVLDDIIGTARPYFETYDIGAFEFTGSEPKYQFLPGGRMEIRGNVEFR